MSLLVALAPKYWLPHRLVGPISGPHADCPMLGKRRLPSTGHQQPPGSTESQHGGGTRCSNGGSKPCWCRGCSCGQPRWAISLRARWRKLQRSDSAAGPKEAGSRVLPPLHEGQGARLFPIHPQALLASAYRELAAPKWARAMTGSENRRTTVWGEKRRDKRQQAPLQQFPKMYQHRGSQSILPQLMQAQTKKMGGRVLCAYRKTRKLAFTLARSFTHHASTVCGLQPKNTSTVEHSTWTRGNTEEEEATHGEKKTQLGGSKPPSHPLLSRPNSETKGTTNKGIALGNKNRNKNSLGGHQTLCTREEQQKA